MDTGITAIKCALGQIAYMRFAQIVDREEHDFQFMP